MFPRRTVANVLAAGTTVLGSVDLSAGTTTLGLVSANGDITLATNKNILDHSAASLVEEANGAAKIKASLTITTPVLTTPTINAATVTGNVAVSAAADIQMASGAFISLPSLTVDNAPTIRAAAVTTRGLYYRNDEGHLKMHAADGQALDPSHEFVTATVSGSGTISHGASKAQTIFLKVTTSNVTNTATPNIEAGAYDGQRLIVHMDKDSTGTLTLNDETTPGSGIRTTAGTIVGNARDCLSFVWDAEDVAWASTGVRVNNT